jgi:hypothetical protein
LSPLDDLASADTGYRDFAELSLIGVDLLIALASVLSASGTVEPAIKTLALLAVPSIALALRQTVDVLATELAVPGAFSIILATQIGTFRSSLARAVSLTLFRRRCIIPVIDET